MSWMAEATDCIAAYLWKNYMENRGARPWSEQDEPTRMVARTHAVEILNALGEQKLLPLIEELSFDADLKALTRNSTEWKRKPGEN